MKVLRYPVYAAGWRFFDLRRYGRDHRKILVVDDKEGYVGGYNIGSAYETEWRDTHVRITGPGVSDLRRAFADFWNLHRRRRLRASERPLLVETASVWEPHIRFQRNVPRLWMFPIRGMYLEAINRASTNVWMTQAYFIPDQDFVDALHERPPAAASTSGSWCRSSPTTSWPTGSPAATSPSCSTPGCGSSGSRTRWCTPRPSTVDGSWSTVGTANIDRLSLQGNYEINVEVIDPALAKTLEEIWTVDESNCIELTTRRVGGPRPAPAVHRAGAAAAAARCSDPVRPGPGDHRRRFVGVCDDFGGDH